LACLVVGQPASASSVVFEAVDFGSSLNQGAGFQSPYGTFFFGVNAGNDPLRGAVEFDISTLPLAAPIDSAILSLPYTGTYPGGTGAAPYSTDVHGYSGNGAVDPGDMTSFGLLATVNSGAGFLSIDVTSLIQTLVDGGDPFAGFMLKFTSESGTNTQNKFTQSASLMTLTVESSAIPEPTTAVLLTAGLAGLAVHGRRRPLR
jgi:hypothetical protein